MIAHILDTVLHFRCIVMSGFGLQNNKLLFICVLFIIMQQMISISINPLLTIFITAIFAKCKKISSHTNWIKSNQKKVENKSFQHRLNSEMRIILTDWNYLENIFFFFLSSSLQHFNIATNTHNTFRIYTFISRIELEMAISQCIAIIK